MKRKSENISIIDSGLTIDGSISSKPPVCVRTIVPQLPTAQAWFASVIERPYRSLNMPVDCSDQ